MNTLKKNLISTVAMIISCNMIFLGRTLNDINIMKVSALDISDICTNLSDSIFSENVLTSDLSSNYTSYPNQNYLQINNDGTINRIVYTSVEDGLCIETYSPDLQLISTQEIDMELPIWGTFYSGSEYNFCVFGQMNIDEEETQEVIRIVKYSKDWQRLDSVSYYGCNTQIPFMAGRPRLTENDGKLYLHASHTMFEYEDGLNHQSSMDFYINIDDMSTFYSRYNISNIDFDGYVSHSFDQYVVADSSYVYTLDLGDAFPRSVVIVRRELDGTYLERTNVLDIVGTLGANATGVSLGAFELSTNNCITVGNSTSQIENDGDYYTRNIFLGVTSKDLSTNKIIWLTNFTEESMVSTPKLVKLDNDTFIVMWNETDNDDAHVVKIDGSGNILEDVYIDNVKVSDCDPIIIDNQIVWYCGNCVYDDNGWFINENSNMYHIEYTNLSQYENIENIPDKSTLGDCNSDEKINSVDLLTLKKYLLGISDDINLTNADVNQDSKVNTLDLLTLKKYLLGLSDEF